MSYPSATSVIVITEDTTLLPGFFYYIGQLMPYFLKDETACAISSYYGNFLIFLRVVFLKTLFMKFSKIFFSFTTIVCSSKEVLVTWFLQQGDLFLVVVIICLSPNLFLIGHCTGAVDKTRPLLHTVFDTFNKAHLWSLPHRVEISISQDLWFIGRADTISFVIFAFNNIYVSI